jgi:hypothetical protein
VLQSQVDDSVVRLVYRVEFDTFDTETLTAAALDAFANRKRKHDCERPTLRPLPQPTSKLASSSS